MAVMLADVGGGKPPMLTVSEGRKATHVNSY